MQSDVVMLFILSLNLSLSSGNPQKKKNCIHIFIALMLSLMVDLIKDFIVGNSFWLNKTENDYLNSPLSWLWPRQTKNMKLF